RGGAPSAPLVDVREEAIAGWPGTLVRAQMPVALAPGATATIAASFRTVLPERYGVFGVTDDTLLALRGWYPLLAARDAEGAWLAAPDIGPATVDGVAYASRGRPRVCGTRSTAL